MTLAEANIKFTTTGTNEVKIQIESVGNALDSTAKKAQNATGSILKIAAGNIAANMFEKLKDSVVDFGKDILQAGMNFQTTNAQFEALGMNATKDRKSTRLNSSHTDISRMPSSA